MTDGAAKPLRPGKAAAGRQATICIPVRVVVIYRHMNAMLKGTSLSIEHACFTNAFQSSLNIALTEKLLIKCLSSCDSFWKLAYDITFKEVIRVIGPNRMPPFQTLQYFSPFKSYRTNRFVVSCVNQMALPVPLVNGFPTGLQYIPVPP